MKEEAAMRANIIIHSISGNLYLIAETFTETLQTLGIDARLYRVSDPDLHIEANERTEVNEYYEEITSLPEASCRTLEKADAIILGTPSRFGMPTAEMKGFIDSTWPLYRSRALEGKLFYAFSSSSVSEDDGLKAAQGLYTWAGMMGKTNIPYSVDVHKVGEIRHNRPTDDIDFVAEHLGTAILAF